MQREPVTSAALRSVGYDRETGDLELEFRSGRIYRYAAVPAALHDWLLRTRNKAVFVAHHLAGRYGERSLPDAAAAPSAPLEQALRDSLARLDEPG
jgi:KTSC domain